MKRALCIFLCVLMLLMAPLTSYKKADANILAIPFVIGGTFTLGGVLAATVCVAAALYGVSVIIDNWDDMSNTIGNALNESTGEVKEWWDNVTNSAVRNDDPVYTFDQAKASGELINFMDYYKPPKNDDDKKIDVTLPVAAKIIEVLEKKNNYPIVNNPTLAQSLKDSLKNRNISINTSLSGYLDNVANNAIFDYHLYWQTGNNVHINYNIEKKPYLYIYEGTGGQIALSVKTDEVSKVYYMWRRYSDSASVDISLSEKQIVTGLYGTTILENISNFALNNKQISDESKAQIVNQLKDAWLYYNDTMEIRLSDNMKIVFPELADLKLSGDLTKVNPYKVSKVKINNGEKTSLTITPNDDLLNTLNTNVNNGGIKSTDDMMDNIIKVNNDSNGSVLDVSATSENVPVTPDDGTGVVPETSENWKGLFGYLADFLALLKAIPESIFEKFKAMLTSILDAIKNKDFSIDWSNVINLPGRIVEGVGELLARLFLPNDIIIETFVDSVMSKVTAQTGILTYPLSLVIRFLNFIMELGESDCIIKLPSLSFMGQKLMQETSFNFTEYVKKDEIKEIYNVYKMVVNFIMIMWVVNLARIRLDDVIKGG